MSSRKDLAKVIVEKSKKGSSKAVAKSVASYLLENNQVNTLDSLLRDVQVLREADGHVEADVFTAHDLTSAELASVKDILKTEFPDAKSIQLHQIHDESVIGGLKVRTATKLLDLTVRKQLDTFKRLTTKETA